MASDMIEVVFQVGTGRRVALAVGERAYADSDEPFDRDWVTARMAVRVDAFAGASAGLVRVDELIGFQNSLKHLAGTLRGQTRFETLEDWFRLDLEGDGLGHIAIEGELRDEYDGGQSLNFAFEIDQTALAAPLAALARAIDRLRPAARRPR